MTSSPRSNSRAIAAALLVLAFLAGGAAGVIADRWLAPRPQIRIVRDMSPVLDRLGLTPQQRAQADSIIQRSAPRTHDVMLEVAERLRAVSDSVDAELRAILTPDQRVRLDSARRQPMLMLKRKTPGNVTVDTVLPRSR